MRSERHRGVALPVVLLLLVALTLVAHGTLYLARRELDVARASVRDLRGRLAAEGAVRAVTSTWPGELAHLPVGGLRSLGAVELAPGVVSDVTVRRLARELFLAEAVARQEGWPGAASSARLVWVVEPGAVVESFGAVVRVGTSATVEPGSRVDGSDVTGAPDGWEEVCSPLADLLASLYPGGTLPGVEVGARDPPGLRAGALLGPLTAGDLLERADRAPVGLVTPAPAVRFGACAEEARSWGSPDDSLGPCGDQLPLIVAPESLTVMGGRGQGVLVVGGSLRLSAGATFRGLVLVAGDVSLEEGARVQGLVRALGGVTLAGNSLILGSGCTALRALREAAGLANPVPLPERSWVSPW